VQPGPKDDEEGNQVPVVALLLALVLVAGAAAAGVTLLGGRNGTGAGAGAPRRSVSPTGWDACRTPQLGAPAPVPASLGSWAFHLVVRGTFGKAVAAPDGNLDLLQACGAEETSLRVVRIGPGGRVAAVSTMFPRAALLASDLVAAGGALFLATAHLDLSAEPASAPYEIDLERLDATTLRVTGSAPLGRGTQAELAAGGGNLLLSTGSRLLAVRSSASNRLETHPLLTLGRSALEHLAVDPTTGLVVVSAFVPGATGPAVGAVLESFRVKGDSLRRLALEALPPGSSVQALVAGDGRAVLAGGSGVVTNVTMLRLPRLGPDPDAGRRGVLLTTLEAAGLVETGGVLFVVTPSSLECRSAETGQRLATTRLRGSPLPAVTALARAGSLDYAVTAAGVGEVAMPVACG
jgi:hypothetical protein